MKLNIPIAKGGASIEVDTERFTDAAIQYFVSLGLKAVLARGMTNITKAKVADEATRKRMAMEKAEENLAAAYEGKIRMTGGVKPKGTSGAETTEAMRLARLAVKDTIKANGGKVSHYDASEITKAAKELIAADPSYLEQAKANLAERTTKPKVAIDVAKIAVSAKKVAEAEQKKADAKIKREAKKDKAPLSAKQAGKVAPRATKSKPVHA
jgi:hypothetical protein